MNALLAVGLAATIVAQPPPDQLLDDARLATALQELARSPRVWLETIGRTHQGRPITLVIVALPQVLARLEEQRGLAARIAGPGVGGGPLAGARLQPEPLEPLLKAARLPALFAGASWGHEASAVEGLVAAARTLAFDDSEPVQRALAGTIALIVPLMNPDGRARALEEWRRTPLSNGDAGIGNAFHFLLNRDFVHATQPESRAIVETLIRYRPVVAVDQHEDVYNLGVRLPEVCFVEPFRPGFDVEEHALSREATERLGRAIAARWRGLGFRVLFDPEGDDRFAPLPPPGQGLNPVASSAGRLNLMASLHGLTSFITESARTPGSQSWKDRVAQKSSSVLASLLEIAERPGVYAAAVRGRREEHARAGADRFVVVPESGQPRDGLEQLLGLLRLHGVGVVGVSSPWRALLVPLRQDEAQMARHLLLGERSKLNELPPALGLRVVRSEALSEAEREAFRHAPAEPPSLAPPERPERTPVAFAARQSVAATALANTLLRSGAARVWRRAGRFVFEAGAPSVLWEADRSAVPLSAAELPAERPLVPPRIGLYSGQGVALQEWGEVAWSLEQGGFACRVLDTATLAGALPALDVLVVPNGSAAEIAEGWNPDAVTRRSPWQPAERRRGLGPGGLAAIREFVLAGGTYVGIGAGGAALAAHQYLQLSRAESVPANRGLGQVLLSVSAESPVAFGYGEDPQPAFVYAPPGGPALGFAFRALPEAVVAHYAGVRQQLAEQSFVSTAELEAGLSLAAIVHERRGRGQLVLFGVAPTFRGQWRSSFALLYNALWLGASDGTARR